MSTVISPNAYALYQGANPAALYDSNGQPVSSQPGASGSLSGSSYQGRKAMVALFAIPQFYAITASTGAASVATTDLVPSSEATIGVLGRGYQNSGYASAVSPMTTSPATLSADGNIGQYYPSNPAPTGGVAGGYTGIQAQFLNNDGAGASFDNNVAFTFSGLTLSVEDARPALSGGGYVPIALQSGVTTDYIAGFVPQVDGSFVAPAGAGSYAVSFTIPEAFLANSVVGNYRVRIIMSQELAGQATINESCGGGSVSLGFQVTTVTSSLGDMNTVEFDAALLGYTGGPISLGIQAAPTAQTAPGTMRAFIYSTGAVVPPFWTGETLCYEAV